MVSAPLLRAISATTGAAPDPVPPPMPAVRNTMVGAPATVLTSSCWLSSAPRDRSSIAAGTPAAGQLLADVHLGLASNGPAPGRSVLDRNELDAAEPSTESAVDALLPAATDADPLDPCVPLQRPSTSRMASPYRAPGAPFRTVRPTPRS